MNRAKKTPINETKASSKGPGKQRTAKPAGAKEPAAKPTPAKPTPRRQPAAPAAVPGKSLPKVAAPSPKGSSAADVSSAYTLTQLTRRAGPATVEQARALVMVPDAQLIAQGAQAATSRITTDCGRLYGQTLDILAQATPKAKAALLGVTADLLRVAVFAAQHGDELYAARNQGLALQKARQTSRRATAATVLSRGAARREQLRAVYLAITGDEPTWRGRILAAYGIAKEPSDLAQALTSLVDLGAELVTSSDAGTQARQQGSGLTAALLDEVRDLGAEIALLGPAGQASRELSAVAQGEVDLWDGINLVLLERVMNLVNAAHELEPSIPRLSPAALRTYFYGSPVKKSPPAAAPNATAAARPV